MTRDPDSPSPLRPRLWTKLLLAYLLPTGLIGIGIGWLAHQAARNAMESQLGEALMAVARNASQQVGRPRAVSLQPGDEQTRTYRNLMDKLADLKLASRVERIFLFDSQERALVDSDAGFAIGEPIADLAANRVELQEVFAGNSRSSMLFTGQDGKLFKTGFAPVRIDGRVVAAVGVDGSAVFFGPLSRLNRTLAIVGAVALALVVLVALLVSHRITRPLDRLTRAARDIGLGELEGEIRVETSDEIGMLASTLNDMRQSILARDRQLQIMLSGIAHEVRNPLGGMTLFVGLLAEELSDDHTAKKYVERIAGELDYLARVVNDFLDFARKKPVDLSQVDPGIEFEKIHSLCASELAGARVEMEIRVSAETGLVYWDQEGMRRALINLVRNAIQASSASQERSLIELTLDPDQRGGLLLKVSDHGCGIPEEKLDRVFEPFFTTRQQGTGLGLALVRKTVASHGGTITVSSKEDVGTTFTIRLPAEKTDQIPEDS